MKLKVIENSLAGPATKMACDLQSLGHLNVNTFVTRKLEIRVQNAVFKDSLKFEVNSREYRL